MVEVFLALHIKKGGGKLGVHFLSIDDVDVDSGLSPKLVMEIVKKLTLLDKLGT